MCRRRRRRRRRSSLDPLNIKEGDGVYFECSIQANPRSYKVVRKHDVSLRRRYYMQGEEEEEEEEEEIVSGPP